MKQEFMDKLVQHRRNPQSTLKKTLRHPINTFFCLYYDERVSKEIAYRKIAYDLIKEETRSVMLQASHARRLVSEANTAINSGNPNGFEAKIRDAICILDATFNSMGHFGEKAYSLVPILEKSVRGAKHDARNVVLGLKNILKGANGRPEKIALSLKSSLEGFYSGVRLLHEFLEWAQIRLEGADNHVSAIDAYSCAEKAKSTCTFLADKKGVGIHIDVKENMRILVNEYSVNSIFRNLISNSIKFTEAGKGRKIIIAAQKNHDYGIFKVSDEGVGMDCNRLNELFRGDSGSMPGTDGEIGTGFGLNRCKEIVEGYGGTLRVESAKNKGTTVHFTLPLAKN